MRYSLKLLGPLELRRGTEPVTLRRKGRALLAYLAATDQPHRRQKLADIFCQEANDPANVLRLLLSRIRQQLGVAAFVVEGDTVKFNGQNGCWVDSQEFEGFLAGDLSGRSPDQLEAALNHYRGDFLDGLALPDAPEFELWLLGERARLRQLYERGLAELVSRLIAAESYEAAIRWVQPLIQSNPLLEEPHARLMWLYAKTGQRAAALKQFEQYQNLLARELAVSPTPALMALYDQILANRIEASRPLLVAADTEDLRQVVDFVGREAEINHLRRAWQAAEQGRGSVVLIEAEAGGGKTRLVEEFSQPLPSTAFLLGECYESARTLPYSPWIELLETRLSRLNEAHLHQLSTFAQDYLQRLLPSLAARLGRPHPPEAPTSGGEVERLFTVITDFLFRLPDTPPQIIFIDNLQWADEASLRLFYFIARRAPALNTVLIGAFRREEAEDVPALQTLRHDLEHLAPTHLVLAALDLPAVTNLTAQLWPKLPSGYRSRVCDMLRQATGGNPLFVTEILRELTHSDQLPAALPVPASARELIRRRLHRVPDSGRQVIDAIAVLGLPVTPDQARQTSGRSQEETFSAIDWGLRQGLLVARAEFRPTRYDFSHDVVREAVVDALSHIRRQLLHRRAAAALEPAHVSPATLAYHWHMAEEPAQELIYTIRAAQQAAGQFAHAEAITYLSRALALTPEADLAERFELLLLRESAAGALGTREAQRQDLAELGSLAERLANPHKQIMVALRLASLERDTSHFEAALVAARFATELAQTLDDADQETRSRIEWGTTLWRQGDYEAARPHLELARQLSEKAHLSAEQCRCHLILSAIYRAWGDYERSVTAMQRALQVSRETGDWFNEASALNNLGVVATDEGDYLQAEAYYSQALDLYQRMRDRWNQALVMGNRGGVFIELGDYAAALATVSEAAQIFTEIGDRRALSYQYCDLSLIAHYQGDQAAALAHSQTALELATAVGERPGQANASLKLGHALAALGQPAEAAAAYRQALEWERELGQLSPAMEALAGLARVALSQHQQAEALAYVEEILVYLETNSLAGAWEPFLVYLTCYQVLQAGDDARAGKILITAHRLLQERAGKIDDAALRQSFLNSVAVHRAIGQALADLPAP